MKALVLEAPEVLVLRDVPDPAPRLGEVVVAVEACGICGSDVHGYDGSTGRRIPPIVMGHEAAGTVAAVGPGVPGWEVGDRVIFGSTVFCGTCAACLSGAVNLCASRRVVGASTAEHRMDGALAEYVALPARMLVPIPDGLPAATAVFAEPLAVALHAVALGAAGAGDDVVVVGTGVIGLLAIQALRVAGCDDVVGVDPDPGRRELALRLGASAALRPDEVDGGRFDFAIEAAGLQASTETAIASVRRGGTVALVGNLLPRLEIPLQHVVASQIHLVGSCAAANDEGRAVELLASGAVDVEPLLSAVAPLAEGARWFERLHRGAPELLKVVLTPGAAS